MSRAHVHRLPLLAALAFMAWAALAALPALAAAITVNTTADQAPVAGECSGAPGACSLRQAIDLANATPGPDQIVLPAGHYALTVKGAEEDANLSGDLDVTPGEVSISGAGARTTVIDATGLDDRVLDVLPLSSLSLSRLTVTGGRAIDVRGGGIRATEASLRLDQVVVRANVSTEHGRGGGLALEKAEGTLTNSLIAGNRNSGDGGGINGESSQLSIVNTTIANNVVETALYPNNPAWGAFGGAMEVPGGHLELRNVTITGNHIEDNNGGSAGTGTAIDGVPDTATIVNTAIFGNTGTNVGKVGQCQSVLASEGHNLEQQPPSSEERCFGSPTDLIADPMFGALADNGGETDTVALPQGSPAVDAGDAARCPSTDQRGVPRPQFGGCDIGAFELAPAPPPPPPAKPTIRRRGRVRVKASGKTFLIKPGFQVSCPAGGERCTGTIRARAKKKLVGASKFTVAPGKIKKLSLKLNARGAKMLRATRHLRARFEVTARAGAGPQVRARATITLKAPAPR
jgi:CSLREA domain-containing protein